MHSSTAREDDLDPGESALAFLLRPEGSYHVDKSAGQVLEVAQVFGDSVVDIRHYRRGEVVHIGMADDFVVPVDLLPEDHFPVFAHDGAGWVARVSERWAGFVDRRDTRTGLHERTEGGLLRLDDGDTVVFEVGQSLFVARLTWRSRRLAVPLGKEVDPATVAIAAAMGILAAVLGIVAAYAPRAPTSSRNDVLDRIVEIDLVRPRPEPVAARQPAGDEPKAGGGAGPREPRPSRDPRPGNPDEQVARDKVEELFGDLEALSQTTLSDAMTAGIKNLIGTHGTQAPGAGGLTAGRCLSADCTGIGVATGDGNAPWGNGKRPVGDGREWGGTFEPKKRDGQLALDGTPTMMGGIDRADVDRVVKQHLSYLRYCYSRELQKDPSLGGKVSVRFVIAGDGSVSSASVSRTTLGHPPTETCMTNKFLQMQFPALKGGGIAIITYPFVFGST